MYQAGLILEGGGMRGIYTAGVLDAFMDENIEFSNIYGVSAGSCHASSYISKQKGRALRAAINYIDDPNYSSIKSLVTTGNFFGVDMLYSQIPNVYEPFDYETFKAFEGKFYAVVTDVDTGEAVYLRVRDLSKQMWMIRASSSLPLLSKTLVVRGHSYLDGGIADSIPVRRSIADGNHKNVVILTRDSGYRKEPNPAMKLMKLRYPRSKAFVERVGDRHIRYNETLDFLASEEKAGRVFIIRPAQKVEVGRLEKNKDKLLALYELGLQDGKDSMERMKEYLNRKTR